nr:hypothetical protein [uncultured Rhodopila sp.]
MKILTIDAGGVPFTYAQPGWWASLEDPADEDGQPVDEDNAVRAAARREARAKAAMRLPTALADRPGLYKAEKHDGGSVQADEVIIAQPPDALPEIRRRDGRDLVHHQAAGEPQPVPAVRSRSSRKSGASIGSVVQGTNVIDAVSLNRSD